MNPTSPVQCAEPADPFLLAFRTEAAARYERLQAERRQAEYVAAFWGRQETVRAA